MMLTTPMRRLIPQTMDLFFSDKNSLQKSRELSCRSIVCIEWDNFNRMHEKALYSRGNGLSLMFPADRTTPVPHPERLVERGEYLIPDFTLKGT
jgi:hypothetical protein